MSRKIRELRYALGLEQRWSKQRILEGYLNIAYFGSQAYGIEVAAQRYFSKPAGRLNPGRPPPSPESLSTRRSTIH